VTSMFCAQVGVRPTKRAIRQAHIANRARQESDVLGLCSLDFAACQDALELLRRKCVVGPLGRRGVKVGEQGEVQRLLRPQDGERAIVDVPRPVVTW
jgi:hypothetical protein